jgi:hypothetical protein
MKLRNFLIAGGIAAVAATSIAAGAQAQTVEVTERCRTGLLGITRCNTETRRVYDEPRVIVRDEPRVIVKERPRIVVKERPVMVEKETSPTIGVVLN